MSNRVLVLSHMFPKVKQPYSGIFVLEQVKSLARLEVFEIMVVSPMPYLPGFVKEVYRWSKYSDQPTNLNEEGIDCYYPRYVVVPGKQLFPLQSFTMYLSVRRLLKQLRDKNKLPDIIHSHSLLPDGWAGHLLSQEFGCKHVCTLHGSDINIYPERTLLTKYLSCLAIKKITHLITVSEKISQRARDLVTGVTTNTIYNGADNRLFFTHDRGLARSKLNLKSDKVYLLFVGNLVAVKGVDILLDAFASVRCSNAELLIVGEGSEQNQLVAHARNLNALDRIHFIGRVRHEQIPLWMSASDIFVLASRSEGFPTVVPEAMMCGLPVVATDVGGVEEAVITGKTGVLVSPNDILQLTAVFENLLRDKQQVACLSNGAKQFANKFTWDSIAVQISDFYSKILASSKA